VLTSEIKTIKQNTVQHRGFLGYFLCLMITAAMMCVFFGIATEERFDELVEVKSSTQFRASVAPLNCESWWC